MSQYISRRLPFTSSYPIPLIRQNLSHQSIPEWLRRLICGFFYVYRLFRNIRLFYLWHSRDSTVTQTAQIPYSSSDRPTPPPPFLSLYTPVSIVLRLTYTGTSDNNHDTENVTPPFSNLPKFISPLFRTDFKIILTKSTTQLFLGQHSPPSHLHSTFIP